MNFAMRGLFYLLLYFVYFEKSVYFCDFFFNRIIVTLDCNQVISRCLMKEESNVPVAETQSAFSMVLHINFLGFNLKNNKNRYFQALKTKFQEL